ncbi:hypothetical protein BG004_003747 [Podila humilis]|nr:hypothetical protein BG004_003747 [Podila humilis]
MSSPIVIPCSPAPDSPIAVFSPTTVSGSFPQMYEQLPPSTTLASPVQQQQQQQHTQHQQPYTYLHKSETQSSHPNQHHTQPGNQNHTQHSRHSNQQMTHPTLSTQQLRRLQQLQIEKAMYKRQHNIEQQLQEKQLQDQERLLQLKHSQALHQQSANQSDKTKQCRRWSLAGRFFDKKKSAADLGNNTMQTSPAAQPIAAPSSGGSGVNSERKASIVDLPKAFLSSLRRTSLASPNEHGAGPQTVPADQTVSFASAPSSLSTSCIPSTSELSNEEASGRESMEEMEDDGQESGVSTKLTSTGHGHATIATPKGPPLHAYSQARLPPRSILKKRSIDPAASAEFFQPSAQAVRSAPNNTQPMTGRTSDSDRNTPADMADLALADNRQLGTRSPVPGLLQPPRQSQPASMAAKQYPEPFKLGVWPPVLNATTSSKPIPHSLQTPPEQLSPPSTPQRAESHGAAFPPDFTPGVQSNSYQDRGGERPQGQIVSHPSYESFSLHRLHSGGDLRVDHPYDQVMGQTQEQNSWEDYSHTSQHSEMAMRSLALPFGHSTGSRQRDDDDDDGDSHHDYGQVESTRDISIGGDAEESRILEGNGMNRRSIMFLDTVEIIPAHRKTDYNRQSDKNATFRILTSDMKSEIRDELNSYKMREMAVHIESMGNTAFH